MEWQSRPTEAQPVFRRDKNHRVQGSCPNPDDSELRKLYISYRVGRSCSLSPEAPLSSSSACSYLRTTCRDSTKVCPYVPGRNVWRDTFSSGYSDCMELSSKTDKHGTKPFFSSLANEPRILRSGLSVMMLSVLSLLLTNSSPTVPCLLVTTDLCKRLDGSETNTR